MSRRQWRLGLAAFLTLAPIAAGAQDYRSPFVGAGAKQVLENEYVIVWDVTWRNGVRAEMSRSLLDQVAVTIEGGALRMQAPGAVPAIEWSSPGSVQLRPKGFAGTLEGTGDRGRREIVLELKDVPPPRGAAVPGVPGQFPRPGSSKLFETDRLVIWDNVWERSGGYRHAHYSQVIGVFIEAGKIRSFADKSSEAREISRSVGEVVFSRPRPAPHSEQSGDPTPRAIFLEFK